jgi:hypothetical protein
MIATIWRFRMRAEFAATFERTYGPAGDWVDLFTHAPGYAGTELLKHDGKDGIYLTIDRCNSEADFHAAKRMLEREYAALDRRCEAYTSEEIRLGLYTICE